VHFPYLFLTQQAKCSCKKGPKQSTTAQGSGQMRAAAIRALTK